jgi:hypothetical protein
LNRVGLSDFTYHFNTDSGASILVIEDLDRGGMSVTNNMEAVLRFIKANSGVDLVNKKIVYRDTQGTYDGVRLAKSGVAHFYSPTPGLRIIDEAAAVKAVRGRYRND